MTTTLCFAKTYKIPEGQHNQLRIPGFVWAKKFKFNATFDSSAIYDINDLSLNKLLGFSDCNFQHHHKNSARIAWRSRDGQIDLFAYVYQNGQRITGVGPTGKKEQGIYLGGTTPNVTNTFTIEVKGNKYIFQYNGVSKVLPRGCDKKNALGYKLFPYFGGLKVAPHDIEIEIN